MICLSSIQNMMDTNKLDESVWHAQFFTFPATSMAEYEANVGLTHL